MFETIVLILIIEGILCILVGALGGLYYWRWRMNQFTNLLEADEQYCMEGAIATEDINYRVAFARGQARRATMLTGFRMFDMWLQGHDVNFYRKGGRI